ncbi:MAG: TolC family protein [Verrucomicrobiota bacterium]
MKLTVLLLCLIALLFAGCTANYYRKSADKEAARLIAEKSRFVPNMDPRFTIQSNAPISLEELPVFSATQDFLGTDKEAEQGARIVSLDKALEIAVKYSRTYQTRKEVLYLQALSLTLARHQYTPIFSTAARTRYVNTHQYVAGGVDHLVSEREVNASASAGSEMLLRTGARITTSFTTDFLRFITGDPRTAYSSQLGATLTQPLWRGAGFQIAMENLTQAERDLLYALREFTRYRKDFALEIASAYYGVLQNRDVARNSHRGYLNFKATAERDKAFVDEGQRPVSSLGQLKQAELSTEIRWINALRTYRQSLDQFKIQIGLPLVTQIILDDRELAQLKILHPSVNVEEAITVALSNRLDLLNQRDALEDADRKLQVAMNRLKPKVDFVSGVNVPAKAGSTPTAPDFSQYSWYAGLEVDPGLDKKSDRNTYRATLINRERTAREWTLALDNVRLQMVDGWRQLDQARRNFEISEMGVELAGRRVEEETMKMELGRGTARELVDAQNALMESRDQRTAALVSHTTTRLRFWSNMGILMIRENGKWEETTDAKAP